MKEEYISLFPPPYSAQPESPSAPSADGDELQFERAEPAAADAATACSACGRALQRTYFEINGKPVCERCRDEVVRHVQVRPGVIGFLRALGGGLAGGIAGAAVFFLVAKLTGYQVGLIGILVGYLVGRGVRWGVQGSGGWLYQGLAVLLTYLAIVSTDIPPILQTVEPGQFQRLGALVYPLAAFVAVAVPFLRVAKGQVMGLVIIAISLYEAWKLNARRTLSIGGPYPVTARPNSNPAAELPPAPLAPA